MNLRNLTSPAEARKIAIQTVLSHAALIPGVRPDRVERLKAALEDGAEDGPLSGTLYVEWERSFKIGCSLSFEFARDWEISTEPASVNGVMTRRAARLSFLKVAVSWSGTDRSPAESLASAKLYGQVAELALLLQAMFAEQTIGVLLTEDEMMARGVIPASEEYVAKKVAEKALSEAKAFCTKNCTKRVLGGGKHHKDCTYTGLSGAAPAAVPASPEVA